MEESKSEKPPLQLHLEPAEPLTLDELTGTLGALARQYKRFAKSQGLSGHSGDANLLVSSVSPGSIDIGLLPETLIVGGGAVMAGVVALGERAELIAAFAEKLKGLLKFFQRGDKDADQVTIGDCNDAIAIAGPIANRGGTQTINVINGGVYAPVIVIDTNAATKITAGATSIKAAKQFPMGEKREKVALVLTQIDDGHARTVEKTTPDKGVIEELDPLPKRIFFEEGVVYLKSDMLSGEPNPFQKVYFVDVMVSRVSGKIVSYRVTAYYGSEDISPLLSSV